MNEAEQKFRDRLLSLERSAPTEKYRQELAALHQRRLSPTQRAILVLVTISALGAGVWLGWLAALPPRHLPTISRVGLGFWASCCLASSLLAAGVARRGILKRKLDPNRAAALIYVSLVVFAVALLAWMGQVPETGKRVILAAVALLVFGLAGLFLLWTRLEQMELRTREKLLEIELELFQFVEKSKTTPQ